MEKRGSNYDLQVDIARGIFLQYDQTALIAKFGLQSDEEWIYLRYLNAPVRISRQDGRIEELDGVWRECRRFNTVMTIYDLLCRHVGAQAPSLLGQWCTVGTFIVTGIQDTGPYTGKVARYFDGRVDGLKAACQKLGGEIQPSMAGADLTCRIPVTPFFPVLLQFWQGDEDFPPQILILWDRNADKFLRFETTFYLQGDILERLAQ